MEEEKKVTEEVTEDEKFIEVVGDTEEVYNEKEEGVE